MRNIEKYLLFIMFFGLAYLAVYNLTAKKEIAPDDKLNKRIDSLALLNKKIDDQLYFINHRIDSVEGLVAKRKEKIKILKKHETDALSSTDTLSADELFSSFSEFKP